MKNTILLTIWVLLLNCCAFTAAAGSVSPSRRDTASDNSAASAVITQVLQQLLKTTTPTRRGDNDVKHDGVMTPARAEKIGNVLKEIVRRAGGGVPGLDGKPGDGMEGRGIMDFFTDPSLLVTLLYTAEVAYWTLPMGYILGPIVNFFRVPNRRRRNDLVETGTAEDGSSLAPKLRIPFLKFRRDFHRSSARVNNNLKASIKSLVSDRRRQPPQHTPRESRELTSAISAERLRQIDAVVAQALQLYENLERGQVERERRFYSTSTVTRK